MDFSPSSGPRKPAGDAPKRAAGAAAEMSAFLAVSMLFWACGDRAPPRALFDPAQAEGAVWGNIPSASGAGLPSLPDSLLGRLESFALALEESSTPLPLAVHYPPAEAVFPPEFTPPTFLWADSSDADFWVVEMRAPGGRPFYSLTAGPPRPPPEIDSAAIPPDMPMEVPDPNRYRAWKPADPLWELLKKESAGSRLAVRFHGFARRNPTEPVSRGEVVFTTSRDSVGAPIFYRDVPIMPVRNESGRIQPLSRSAQRLIRWSLREVSRPRGKAIIETLPTCANCHSFARDGGFMGLDIDGPQSDKGTYGLAVLARETVIGRKDVFSWNYDFKEKPPGGKTIGFLSRISPDGAYVITTVNEQVFIQNYRSIRYIQVFYPTRGVLAFYSKATGDIRTLPGADETAFVHCDPVWSPDGKYIVFARAPAKDPYVEGQPDPKYPNDPNETQIRYNLYRIPFNGGRGGEAVPIEGASHNGMSNNFPKVTPDGRFIVFVQCRNGQLLRPDSRLWIVPCEGGKARLMRCNTREMNSWHSFSPNGRWMVFASKAFSPYTQMFLTHIDSNGMDSPAVLIPDATAANRAVNLPEFVNIPYDSLDRVTVPAVGHMQHLQDAYDLLEAGRPKEAMDRMRRALGEEQEDRKFRSEVQVLLGWLQERTDSGIVWTRHAIRSDPENALAHFNLGVLLERQDRTAEAMRSYRKSLEIDAENAWAMGKLVRIHMHAKDPALLDVAKAVELAEKANRITHYREPSLMKTLARAYSETGRFREALETAGVALKLARERGLNREVQSLEREMALYRRQRPFSSVLGRGGG